MALEICHTSSSFMQIWNDENDKVSAQSIGKSQLRSVDIGCFSDSLAITNSSQDHFVPLMRQTSGSKRDIGDQHIIDTAPLDPVLVSAIRYQASRLSPKLASIESLEG